MREKASIYCTGFHHINHEFGTIIANMYSVTLNGTRSSVGSLFVPQSDVTSSHFCNFNELIYNLSVEQMTSLKMVHEIPWCLATLRVMIKEFASFPYITVVSTIQIARFIGQLGAHLGPTGPRWVPCWPHEPCYLGDCPLWDKGQEPMHIIVPSLRHGVSNSRQHDRLTFSSLLRLTTKTH